MDTHARLQMLHYRILAMFLTWATPFVGRGIAGAAAVVITPPDTLSTVVPGLESWDEAGTDFIDPSDIFTSDVCPLGAAFEKEFSIRKKVYLFGFFKNFLKNPTNKTQQQQNKTYFLYY